MQNETVHRMGNRRCPWQAEDLITASENAHGERAMIRRWLRSSGEILFRCALRLVATQRYARVDFV